MIKSIKSFLKHDNETRGSRLSYCYMLKGESQS
jgi:hypothetical protein